MSLGTTDVTLSTAKGLEGRKKMLRYAQHDRCHPEHSEGSRGAQDAPKRRLMHYILQSYNYNLSDPESIPNLFLKHASLVGIVMLISLIIAIPVGIVVAR